MKRNSQAVNLSSALLNGLDMSNRESKILLDINSLTGFVPSKNIWRSKYWGKNLGASHWLGEYKNKESVLKIQGVKPEISEIYMIEEFSKQNRSQIISSPQIYYKLEWDDKKEYEAIIAEYASGDNVITDGKIVAKKEINTFFKYFIEYREKSIPISPWLAKPEYSNYWENGLGNLLLNSKKAFPNHPFRNKGDVSLAKEAYNLLSKIYQNIELEFMHGHFSCKDLIYQNKLSKKVILFSNLFWKWRYPYYDSVFAYHWFMYELANVHKITANQVEEQRKLWLDEIYEVTGAVKYKEIRKLVNAALLERSVAGFLLDSFLCDSSKPISKYLYGSTKNEAIRLMKEFK